MVNIFTGLIFAFAVTIYTVQNLVDDPSVFINVPGLIVVIGGSFASVLMTFNFGQFLTLFKNVGDLTFKNKSSLKTVLNELEKLSKVFYLNPDKRSLSSRSQEIKHDFLKEAIFLIENNYTKEQIKSTLENQIESRKLSLTGSVDMIKSISKYPPAFGMVGTVFGLIALLKGISTSEGVNLIGQSMSVALVTTLYGLLISNFIFIPLSENIFNKSKSDVFSRVIILEIVLRILDGENPSIIRKSLNSYLRPEEKSSPSNIDDPYVEKEAA